MIRCLKTDYLDFGMLFCLDSHEAISDIIDNGVVEYAQRLKREGKIRFIGASLHNPETGIRLVRENLVDMMMFSINPAFDMMTRPEVSPEVLLDDNFADRAVKVDPRHAELYRLSQSQGIGLTVMKSMAAGKLLSADHSPFATWSQATRIVTIPKSSSSFVMAARSASRVLVFIETTVCPARWKSTWTLSTRSWTLPLLIKTIFPPRSLVSMKV